MSGHGVEQFLHSGHDGLLLRSEGEQKDEGPHDRDCSKWREPVEVESTNAPIRAFIGFEDRAYHRVRLAPTQILATL